MNTQADRDSHVRGGDLLHDDRPGRGGQSRSTDRLGKRAGEEPQLRHRPDQWAVEALRLVTLDRARCDHLPRERPDRLPEQPLVLAQPIERVEHVSPLFASPERHARAGTDWRGQPRG
jgi:hypothetical protein